MKIRLGIRVFCVGLVALFVGVQFNGTPTTAQTPQDQGNVTVTVDGAAVAAALEYWTPQRMASAKPLMPMGGGEPTAGEAAEAAEAAAGPAGPPVSAPGSAGPGAVASAVEEEGASAYAAPGSPAGYSYPFPFTRFTQTAPYKGYPYRTIGKLFFVQNGGNYVCSASVISSANRRLIWTAGHCVSDGAGHWSTNVLFVPAYKNNWKPYGTWAGCQLSTRTAWHTAKDRGEDLGAIKACDRASDGARIANVVGWLGWAANYSRVQHWFDFGYPAAAPFTGKKQVVCAASHGRNDTVGTPRQMGIGCDMTGGSSGGPWIKNFAPGVSGAVNYINGLNSWKYYAQPAAMYGPYFGNAFLSLRNFAEANGA